MYRRVPDAVWFGEATGVDGRRCINAREPPGASRPMSCSGAIRTRRQQPCHDVDVVGLEAPHVDAVARDTPVAGQKTPSHRRGVRREHGVRLNTGLIH